MAHWIEPFLHAMHERRVESLVLASGEPPGFKLHGTLMAASRQAIALEHLLAMARAGLDSKSWSQLLTCGAATWIQEHSGRRYRFEAAGGPSQLRVEVTPETPDPPPRQEMNPAPAVPAAIPETARPGSSPREDARAAGGDGNGAPGREAAPTATAAAAKPSEHSPRAERAAAKAPAESAAPGPRPADEPPSTPAAAPMLRIETGERARDSIEGMLRATHAMRASDLHLTACMPPLVRKDGRMQPLDPRPLEPAVLRELLLSITPARNLEELETLWDTDFGHEIADVSRFRVNLFNDRLGVGAVFRVIPSDMPTPEQLGLPARLVEMTQLSKGIVLVTGPTGSGKSTTLAALMDHTNRTRHDHIITIEDPIEFVHQSRNCLINQREVGTHTQSFKRALREALREDPDIVLVGEMRDLETVHIALETAETGHLVFGTLHTTSAPATIDRLIDQFPAAQQQQIRVMLADTLHCVAAQVLCRRKAGGRVAALEIMVCTPAISNLIREGKTHQIPSIMQTSKNEGMQLMSEALVRLVQDDVIDVEEALARATDRDDVLRTLDRLDLLPSLAPAAAAAAPGRKR